MNPKGEGLSGRAWTMAAWVKVNPSGGADRVIVARGAPQMSHFRLYVQAHFGLLRFYSFNCGDFGCGVVDDDLWHHVAVTQREYALTFYLDGMALYTFRVPGGIVSGSDPVTIGGMPDGTLPLDGAVEDLRMMNRSAGGDEIKAWMTASPHSQPAAAANSRVPPAPLYVDPLFNSAKDGQVVWNRVERNWWYLYMQIRNGMKEPGAAIHHGTTLGAASSADGGLTWRYRGTLQGLEAEQGRNTFWAPHVVWHEGEYHAIVTRVPGINPNWQGDRRLLHFVGDDLLNWRLAGEVEGLDSLRTLDGRTGCGDCGTRMSPSIAPVLPKEMTPSASGKWASLIRRLSPWRARKCFTGRDTTGCWPMNAETTTRVCGCIARGTAVIGSVGPTFSQPGQVCGTLTKGRPSMRPW